MRDSISRRPLPGNGRMRIKRLKMQKRDSSYRASKSGRNHVGSNIRFVQWVVDVRTSAGCIVCLYKSKPRKGLKHGKCLQLATLQTCRLGAVVTRLTRMRATAKQWTCASSSFSSRLKAYPFGSGGYGRDNSGCITGYITENNRVSNSHSDSVQLSLTSDKEGCSLSLARERVR